MDKIRYVNLSVKDKKLKKAYFNSLNKIFNHGIFILGPEVERLEKKLADFCNRKYAIATGSGTDALYLAIKSLDLKLVWHIADKVKSNNNMAILILFSIRV